MDWLLYPCSFWSHASLGAHSPRLNFQTIWWAWLRISISPFTSIWRNHSWTKVTQICKSLVNNDTKHANIKTALRKCNKVYNELTCIFKSAKHAYNFARWKSPIMHPTSWSRIVPPSWLRTNNLWSILQRWQRSCHVEHATLSQSKHDKNKICHIVNLSHNVKI